MYRMKVMKFGGTSIGTPERMQNVAGIVSKGEQKVVVLSALSGTTNRLIEIINLIKHYRVGEARDFIYKFKREYDNFIFDLFSEQEYLDEAGSVVDRSFEIIRDFHSDNISTEKENEFLAQGELLSTGIFQVLLDSKGLKSGFLNALNFMRVDKDGEPDMFFIEGNLANCQESNPGKDIFVTQGFICRDYFGKITNLGRGGSDYSASIIGAAINASVIQIWTDIDGVHNGDPRWVEKTSPVKELSYKEAAELAYFGAGILHPKSVFPAQVKNIPLRLKNTFEPEQEGTLISAKSRKDRIKSVAAKDGIIAIKIRSARMLMAYGFLKNVFEVFEKHKTSIDMISTSEVSVSLTIDNPKNLELLLKDLQSFGEVEYDLDQSIVCVVGDFMADETGMARTVLNALAEIPVRMISYGGSMNNISMLIKSADKKKALESLHRNIFKNR